MTVYIVLYIFLIYMIVLEHNDICYSNKKISQDFTIVPKGKYNKLVISFTLVYLILSLRHPSIGVDLGYGLNHGYLMSFNILSAMSWSDVLHLHSFLNYEKGYVLFNKLISCFFDDSQFLIASCALISILPVFLLIKKHSTKPILSTVIYLGLPSYFILFSGLRQGIALGITFIATNYIIKKKPIKFVISVLIAMLFHKTAIVFFIAYPIFYLKITRKYRLHSLIVLFIVFNYKYELINLSSIVLGKTPVIVETPSYLFFGTFFCIYIFCCSYFNVNSKIDNGLLNIAFIALLALCFTSINQLAIRIADYFMNSLIILLPSVLNRIPSKKTSLIIEFVICLSFSIFSLYEICTTYWMQAYPYYFFWENI